MDHHINLQITRRIKRTLQKSLVDHSVAERKTWAKFGQEKGSKAGPDRATTTVGETVSLKLSAGNKVCNHSSPSISDIPIFTSPSSNRSQSPRPSKR